MNKAGMTELVAAKRHVEKDSDPRYAVFER